MVKKLTLTQHQEIQIAALEVIDAVNRMRDKSKTGPWFGPFDTYGVEDKSCEDRRAVFHWFDLEQSVQRLQRTIDNLPSHGKKPVTDMLGENNFDIHLHYSDVDCGSNFRTVTDDPTKVTCGRCLPLMKVNPKL